MYAFLEGPALLEDKFSWIHVLKYIEKMHSNSFVHGDLLPRNFIFDKQSACGWVINFDLTRKVDSVYVNGYNHQSFVFFRHKDAKAGLKMKTEHDVHFLKQLSKSYFGLKDEAIDEVENVSDLISFFERDEFEISNSEGWHDDITPSVATTNSPIRE
jgi:tRNA A-37 threonylcarbamoyl transferase component Bud32